MTACERERQRQERNPIAGAPEKAKRVGILERLDSNIIYSSSTLSSALQVIPDAVTLLKTLQHYR